MIYDDESLRVEVVRRFRESGLKSVSEWARTLGLHDEQLGAFLRGVRSAEPRLLKAFGLKKVVVYVPE